MSKTATPFLLLLFSFSLNSTLFAQNINELKQLSLEELMNIQVTLVSRQAERLTGAASAIQVLTYDDIKRSTAVRLPEALRLVPNLQVAQANAHGWAITGRGFNGAPLASNSLANKLLVMIDGRTIYTPLFSGVFWDIQNVLLDDIDQIEVVSGPGGSLWGANAVNGVINIRRKSASETQGLYLTGALGTFTRHDAGIRYGDKVGEKVYYKVYGSRVNYDHTSTSSDQSATDEYAMNQAGFRLDYDQSEKNMYTFQGDFYAGKEAGPDSSYLNGQNILVEWNREISETSNLRLQAYIDRTWREQPGNSFSEELTTYDIDFQYAFRLGTKQDIVVGAGYRFIQDRIDTASTLIFDPADLDFSSVNIFIQDEINLVPDKLKFIVGAKLSENFYSGLGLQPNGRVAWTPDEHQTYWAAVSRALRSAGRFDADVTLPFNGKNNFEWEKVDAYELGYRLHPVDNLIFSISGFYNEYSDLRSLDFIDGAVHFENNQKATTWGGEFIITYQPFDWWKVRSGYTHLKEDIEKTSNTVFDGSDSFEALDPEHGMLLHSMMNFPENITFDLSARYSSELPPFYLGANTIVTEVPAYFNLNAKIGWTYNNFEFSFAGRNLLGEHQREFGSLEIPRNVYGRVTMRW